VTLRGHHEKTAFLPTVVNDLRCSDIEGKSRTYSFVWEALTRFYYNQLPMYVMANLPGMPLMGSFDRARRTLPVNGYEKRDRYSISTLMQCE
jgi:hypothetical protein